MTSPLLPDAAFGDSTSGALSAAGRWRYRAAAADGASVRGEIDATSERDAIDALRRRSLWVVELEPIGNARTASPAAAPRTMWAARWSGAADSELAIIMRAMATLLGAGVPLARTLTYAEQEASTPAMRSAFGAIRSAVHRGESLSAAIAAQPTLPAVFAPLIAAGEGSGTLDSSLTLLAAHLERREALRNKLRSALIYPCILGLASAIGIAVIMLVVVPRFATLITDGGGALPFSTRALMALSDVLTRGWWIMLLLGAAAAVVVEQLLRNPDARKRWHASRLSWPIVGRLERLRTAAAYTGTLAVGLRAGISLLGAMSLARAVVGNEAMQTSLAEAEGRVRGGVTLSTALSGVLPPLAERLLDAGETSGDLAGMAARAAEASDAEVERTLSRAVVLIEPLMILGFGGIVGFVALALLQAIYGLNASVL